MVDKSVCIIGGGFYGVIVALHLKRTIGVDSVSIYEQESELLSRASFKNQARVHNGYHYPRSLTTAYRSRENYRRFILDWSQCVYRDFYAYYAIARRNSKTTSHQFTRFCKQVGLSIEKAEEEISELFNSFLISDVYRVEEYAFNAAKLREWSYQELAESGIHCYFNNQVVSIKTDQQKGIEIVARDQSGNLRSASHTFVFNCSYSGLLQFDNLYPTSSLLLKHEITELALIEPPIQIKNIGITVIDGSFFSSIPFPTKSCHSLTHVRYTPHSHWIDSTGFSPYEILRRRKLETRVDRMIRDASRYLPSISKSKYIESLFEVKTVLERNEKDDGRPILLYESINTPRMYSVLGGKIDNVYDILESLDNLELLKA